eukprot:2872895-Rhodomonas_salina.1
MRPQRFADRAPPSPSARLSLSSSRTDLAHAFQHACPLQLIVLLSHAQPRKRSASSGSDAVCVCVFAPVQPLSSLALALTLFLTAAGAVGAAVGGGGARVGVLVGVGVAPHLAQAWQVEKNPPVLPPIATPTRVSPR